MSKGPTSTIPLFAQATFAGAYGKKLPTHLALIIQTISCLQITHIILKTSFPPSDDPKHIIFGFIRTVVAIISSFDTYEGMQWGETVTFMIWLGVWFYLIGYVIFVGIIMLECKQREKIREASKAFTRLNIIHSKLIFFMIHCFGFQLLDSLRQCTQQENPVFYCGTPMTILTVVMLVSNMGIAFVIELTVYQTYKDKNVFSIKNNTHAVVQLAHKAILPPLLTLVSSSMTVNSVLNLIFVVVNHGLIFMRLPYFNRIPLKLAVIFSSVHLTSTSILVFRPAIDGHETCFELLVILLTTGMIIIKLAILDKICEEILKLNFRSPYYVLHLPSLLKEYVLKPSLIRANCNYDYRTLFTYNLMQGHKWEVDDLGDQIKSEGLKVKVNRLAAEELLKCYKRNPTSKELLLFMIQFYIEKIKNVTKAYVLMEKLQELPLFTPNLNNIKHITNQLQTIMFNAYTEHDKSLELLNYFKNREVSTKMKQNIEAEAQLHAEFWGALLQPDLEVYDALQICKKIDMLAENTEKNWKENEDDFIKNFPIPLVMYGIYLNILRGLPHLGHGIIEKFTSGKNSRLLKTIEKWLSQEKAMIIASNQKGSLGKIIDATHSVKNIFNIDRDDLIGRKVNMLMPSMVQTRHDMMIERYNNRPEISLNFNRNVYCKTADQKFFLAELSLRVYPYINKGTGLIATIKKKEVTPVFFVNVSGEIVDCSRELTETFRIDFSVTKNAKLKNWVPEFESINRSFNKVYGHLATGNQAAASSLTEDFHFDEATTKRVRSANTEGHLMLSKGDQDQITSTRGLLNSPRALSREDTQDQIPSEKDEEGHVEIRTFHMSEKREGKMPSNISTCRGLAARKKENSFYTRHKSKIHNMEFAKDQQKKERKVLSEEDMKELCKKYENGSVLMLQTNQKEKDNLMPYSIKVEHFLVERELFKAVRVQKVEKKTGGDSKSKDETTKSNSGTNKAANLELDVIKKKLETSLVKMKSANEKSQESVEPESSGDLTNKKMSMHVNFAEDGYHQNVGRENSISSSSSKSNSQMERGLRVEKTLYQAFKKDKTSRLVRGYLLCFYLAIILIIVLTLVNYFYTKSSFDEVGSAAQLVDVGSERLYNLANIWAVAMYTYCAARIDDPASRVGVSISFIILQVNTLTNSFLQLLNEIGSSSISQTFFAQNIILQVPYEQSILSTKPLDEVTALNLVLQKMEPFTQINNDDFDPNGPDYLFPLNNTMNDLLFSVEDDLRITRSVKQSVYDNNIKILDILVIIQVLACCLVYFSLIPTFISIISDYKKFFKTLRIVSSKSVIAREREIKMFQHGIHESVESEKLIENMNKMMYRATSFSTAEVSAMTVKLNRNGKLVFKKVNRVIILLLVVALLLFGVVLGVFSASTVKSLQSIKNLQTVDQAAIIAQNMVYQNLFMGGSVTYYMSFINVTTMKLRNLSPLEQFEAYLTILQNTNNDLLDAINIKPELYNSNLQMFLSGDICSYLEEYAGISSICASVLKGGKTGLFGLNEMYANILSEYVTSFQQNATEENYKALITNSVKNSASIVTLMSTAYRYLKDDLLDIFLAEIQDQKSIIGTYCIGICLSCFFVVTSLRFLTLRLLVDLDRMRYKVFRIIPASLMTENRIILYYLKRNYPNEVAEINSII